MGFDCGTSKAEDYTNCESKDFKDFEVGQKCYCNGNLCNGANVELGRKNLTIALVFSLVVALLL